MNSSEAVSHIVGSTKYWSNPDNSHYDGIHLPIDEAFEIACKHVIQSHGYNLTVEDIKRAKMILKLDICGSKVCKGLKCRILRLYSMEEQ